jgi:hypothetical protein
MTNAQKNELFAASTRKAYLMICQITGTGVAYRIVQDSVDHVISGQTFVHTDFSYSPPDPSAQDSTASVTIDDTDRMLTGLIAGKRDTLDVTIGVVDSDDMTVYIEGPFEHTVTSKSFSPADGKVTLKLSSLTRLGYNASRYSYGTTEFPGLFG